MKTAKLPLMPKATAIWLVDNTSLSFRQIGDFCGMHELEIKGIADGEVGVGIKGLNPITSGQLTKDEIEIRSQNGSKYWQSLYMQDPTPDDGGIIKKRWLKNEPMNSVSSLMFF